MDSYHCTLLTCICLSNSFFLCRYNRMMTIKKYANIATERYMQARERRYLVILKSDYMNEIGNVLTLAKDNKLQLGHVKMSVTGDVLIEFIGFDGGANKFIDSAPTYTCVSECGPEEILETLDDAASVNISKECSLCLIKPHIMKDGLEGEVLKYITDNGFNIGALQTIYFSPSMSEELFSVYRNIYRPYCSMLEHMSSGPCLAVMIIKGPSALADTSGFLVDEFREFCGPLNPGIAKTLRPKSVRGMYGSSLVLNAVHCTDLPEDGDMECKFMFETMATLDAK